MPPLNIAKKSQLTVLEEIRDGIDGIPASGELVTISSTQLPASLGGKTAAQSLPVTLSTDDPFASNFGDAADPAATSDAGTFSLMAFIKRSLQNWTALFARLGGVFAVEPLGVPTIARQVSVTTSNLDTALTTTCRRISIKARTCDMRYVVGNSAQTANATSSHFIEAGERLDIAVPLNAHIAVIRDTAATADGKLSITELE